LVLHQHGNHPAPKISASQAAAATAPPKSAVTLPAATLREYVGRYRLAPGRVLNVTVKDGHLDVQLTGQPPVPNYASAKDKFFSTIVDTQIDFVRDNQEKVIALVLHQNGAAHHAPRVEK
jgi:hypothetical protein